MERSTTIYMAINFDSYATPASIRNLKIPPISMLANNFQFIGLGIIFYYLQDIPYSRRERLHLLPGVSSTLFWHSYICFEVLGGAATRKPDEDSSRHEGVGMGSSTLPWWYGLAYLLSLAISSIVMLLLAASLWTFQLMNSGHIQPRLWCLGCLSSPFYSSTFQ